MNIVPHNTQEFWAHVARRQLRQKRSSLYLQYWLGFGLSGTVNGSGVLATRVHRRMIVQIFVTYKS